MHSWSRVRRLIMFGCLAVVGLVPTGFARGSDDTVTDRRAATSPEKMGATRSAGPWFAGIGGGLAGGDHSFTSDHASWWGPVGGAYVGRAISDNLAVALEFGGLSLARFDLYSDSGDLTVMTTKASLYLMSKTSGPYLRGDVGYSRAVGTSGFGSVYDARTRRSRFDGGKDAVMLVGAVGVDVPLDTGYLLLPQVSFEYHQFSGWYVLVGTFTFYIRVSL